MRKTPHLNQTEHPELGIYVGDEHLLTMREALASFPKDIKKKKITLFLGTRLVLLEDDSD